MPRFTLAFVMAVAAIAGASAVNAADKIGIAICDDFLTKYESCVGTKIPAAQQATFKTQIDQMRKSWTDLAKNPSTKPSLESACKQTVESMKTAVQAYGCSF
jgi:hypothetical protein